MSTAPPGESSVFKWVCLLVAVAALSAYGWMLNDVRLEVKELARKADKLADKADALVTRTDKDLPRILTQAEQVTRTVDMQLPPLLAHAETTADNLTDLSENLRQSKALLGVVHGASPDKSLLAYGASLLDLVGQQPKATIGVKKPGPARGLARPIPAKTWANNARKDAHFLSLIAKNKSEVLHGLARTMTAAPWYIQMGEQAAPRLLADWLQENHPDSKGL
jgi:hypothetical protein